MTWETFPRPRPLPPGATVSGDAFRLSAAASEALGRPPSVLFWLDLDVRLLAVSAAPTEDPNAYASPAGSTSARALIRTAGLRVGFHPGEVQEVPGIGLALVVALPPPPRLGPRGKDRR